MYMERQKQIINEENIINIIKKQMDITVLIK